MIAQNVTFGISSKDNNQGLVTALASVLAGTVLPAVIQVRMEGVQLKSNDYHLDAVFEMARFHNVDLQVIYTNSKGVRAARDWHLQKCATEYLWMGDDDCFYKGRCLKNFLKATVGFNISEFSVGFFVGCKYDVVNRRGYADFNTKSHGPEDLVEDCQYNWYWDEDACVDAKVRVHTIDTGNVLLHTFALKRHNICFQMFVDSVNAGGEDTLVALQCEKAGLQGYFVPSAQAVHFGQPKLTNFGEFEARAEMVLRTCDLMGYNKETVKCGLFKWLFNRKGT